MGLILTMTARIASRPAIDPTPVPLLPNLPANREIPLPVRVLYLVLADYDGHDPKTPRPIVGQGKKAVSWKLTNRTCPSSRVRRLPNSWRIAPMISGMLATTNRICLLK